MPLSPLMLRFRAPHRPAHHLLLLLLMSLMSLLSLLLRRLLLLFVLVVLLMVLVLAVLVHTRCAPLRPRPTQAATRP